MFTVLWYTTHNFVFIPDFDHEKLVKLLQQIWVMKFSVVVALLPNLNSTNKRTFRSFVTGAHVEKYLWNHPCITSAKKLDGWGQKIHNFCWRSVQTVYADVEWVGGSEKVQKCADVIYGWFFPCFFAGWHAEKQTSTHLKLGWFGSLDKRKWNWVDSVIINS